MPQVPISPFVLRNSFVFTSGQIYLTPEGKLLDGSLSEQARQVMQNLEKVLSDAGTSFEKVVKTTIYLTDMSLYGELNQVYASYFDGSYPAREVIGVKELPLGAKIEISVVAEK